MSSEEVNASPVKKIKPNNQNQSQDKDWIVIKKKTTPLTITIADHTKLNRFYSHKSIQKYIRYLFTQTCPNPMWLSIKRQSQIQHIFYFDIEIQDYLFEKMLEEKSLIFLAEMINTENKGVFRQQKLNRFVWDSLFVYDEEEKFEKEELFHKVAEQHAERKMSCEIYNKYLSNILTPQELKENLYPDLSLPLYQKYHTIVSQNNQPTLSSTSSQSQSFQNKSNKNLILVIDCQMVTTCAGFQLARCTIVNYEQEVVFDEFFKPKNPILNYNTEFSGITKDILDTVTNTISNTLHPFLTKLITHDTILIGHSLENDFNAMEFFHSKVVDTSVLFRRKNGSKLKLKNLADKILNRKIQSSTHDSKQDCLATLHLVQARLQNQKLLDFQKQYHLLRDLIKSKHGILIVDSEIQKLRQYNSIHFEKVQPYQSSRYICDIIKKYSDKNHVAVPKTVFARFQKSDIKDWEIYYQEIDDALEKLFHAVPQGTVLMLNFQVNQLVRIVPFSSQDSKKPRSRPFCVPIPKN